MAKTTTKKTSTRKTGTRKKVAGKTTKKIEKREMKKSFWFKLTAEEKKHHADEMVRVMTEKGKKELQFSDVKKKWQTEIKELETEIDEHRQTYNAGKEWREVDCIEIKDFQKLEVRYMVGKKIMESRPMDDREKQMVLAVKGKPIDIDKTQKTLIDKADDEMSKDVKEVMKEETGKKTKKSSLDRKGPVSTSSAYQELHGGGAEVI